MVFSASEKTFSEKTDHVVQDNGELKRVGVYTLPGQPEKGVRTRGRQGEWTRNLLLAALISPSLGTIGGEDSICEGRGDEGKDEGDGTHCGGYYKGGKGWIKYCVGPWYNNKVG